MRALFIVVALALVGCDISVDECARLCGKAGVQQYNHQYCECATVAVERASKSYCDRCADTCGAAGVATCKTNATFAADECICKAASK
jgi:hypothetical protein